MTTHAEIEKKDIDSVDESYEIRGDRVSAEAVIKQAKSMFPNEKKLAPEHLEKAKKVILDNRDKLEEETLEEGMKIVSKHGAEGETHSAKVYKDSDWGEYRVKFYKDGKHVGEDADYHTDDLDDAKSTADSQLSRYKSLAESATADNVETWKQSVRDHYPDHADKLVFKSRDQGKHISAEHPDHADRSFGVYDIEKGEGQILESTDVKESVSPELTESYLSFVKLVQEDKALAAKSLFEKMIDSKIAAKIEEKRKAVAQALFNKK